LGEVEVRLLGPIELVDRGRAIELPGGQPRALFGLLLLDAPRVVAIDRLIDGLWGPAPPATAAKVVQGYVSRLRRVLPLGTLATQAPGYVLQVRPRDTDLGRFERLRRDADAAMRDGRIDPGAALLREALALWRGPALADVAPQLWQQGELARLEERRLTTLEALFEAELALGLEAQVIGEVEALTAEEPLRERPRAQLMLALYRAGRQAEALDVYRDLSRLLAGELGLEPGPELRELERMILAHDPALAPAPRPVVAPSPAAAEPNPRAARRRVVTVLACDLTEAEPLDVVDPEALQARLTCATDRLREAVARHGGVTNAATGHVLTAVFGLPSVHEDDALRALRAALDAQAGLTEEAVGARIGVASGEVVAGVPGRPMVGDPVRRAARLARASPPGAVLLDETTALLGRGAVDATPFDAPELRRGGSLAALLLRDGAARPRRRPPGTPLVGRTQELQAIVDAFERAQRDQRCEIVTVVGAAGVGKSRLVRELMGRVDALAVTGRCLSYGDGITYWPVRELLGQLEPWAGGIDPEAHRALAVLAGKEEGSTSKDAVAWSLRRLLEAAAVERPLVAVVDDLQWGEDAFLDLVEYVGLVSSGSPILLVCLARPELLERRPAWPGVLRLEPLEPDDIERLLATCIDQTRRRLPPTAIAAIVARAGGNPLFAEELASMLLEVPEARAAIPPTVMSVLAARLDQLAEPDRQVIEAAAVEGEVFHAAVLGALDDSRRDLTSSLTVLVRKELVRPAGSDPELGDRFRFRHALVRDAAYAGMPKTRRADLHERLAAWVEHRAARVPEGDELMGYHLEQAYRYRSALAPGDGRVGELSASAGARLAAAGRRALGRADVKAAAGLLRRAVDLDAAVEQPIELELDLADALYGYGKLEDARLVLERAATRRALDEREAMLVRLVRANLDMATAPDGVVARLERLGSEAVPVFEQAADEGGLARAWAARALALHVRAQYARRNDAVERAAGHARLDGNEARARELESLLAAGHLWGPTPAREGIAWLDAHRQLEHEPVIIGVRSVLTAMDGRLDEARALYAGEVARSLELGVNYERGSFFAEYFVDLLAGDYEAAAEHARAHCELLERMGERTVLSTRAAQFGRVLCMLGRYDEADARARQAEALGASDDALTQILWRQVRAIVLVHRRQESDGTLLAREAASRAARTDALDVQGDALFDQAEVLAAAGEPDEAAAAAAEAVSHYERKGNVVMAGRARTRLGALRAGVSRANSGVR
jgi:DNA-binding SARP family transcriptional activator